MTDRITFERNRFELDRGAVAERGRARIRTWRTTRIIAGMRRGLVTGFACLAGALAPMLPLAHAQMPGPECLQLQQLQSNGSAMAVHGKGMPDDRILRQISRMWTQQRAMEALGPSDSRVTPTWALLQEHAIQLSRDQAEALARSEAELQAVIARASSEECAAELVMQKSATTEPARSVAKQTAERAKGEIISALKAAHIAAREILSEAQRATLLSQKYPGVRLN